MTSRQRALGYLSFILLIMLSLHSLTGVWILLIKSKYSWAGLIEYYSPTMQEKSFGGILEIYWFHIFSMSLVAFVFAHFLPFISGVSQRIQMGISRALMLAPVLFVAAPFLSQWVHPQLAVLAPFGLMTLQLAMSLEIYLLFKSLIVAGETVSEEKST